VLGPDGRKQLKQFARLASVGIELALSIVLGMLGGRWLDSKLSTEPWLGLLGLLLGAIAGFRSLFMTVRATQQKQKHEAQQQNEDRPDE
jgi:ATP synthase protein I